MQKKLKTLLSIAGSDPTGGAGLQADIRVGTSMGLHVMTAVTAVTAQNSKGVYDLGSVSSELLKFQLDSIIDEVMPDAVKIGMIGSKDNFLVVEEFLKKLSKTVPVVIDPIFASSADGKKMAEKISDGEWSWLYREKLLPFAYVLTPNLTELQQLLNLSNPEDLNFKEIRERLRTKYTIITGTPLSETEMVDYLIMPSNEVISLQHKKIECQNLHGTGCVFSSFIASYLALGFDIVEAFKSTNSKMKEIISRSTDYSLGKSKYGPLNITHYKL